MHTPRRFLAPGLAALLLLTACGGATTPGGTLSYTLKVSHSQGWSEAWEALEPYDINTEFETSHGGNRRLSWGTSMSCEFTVFDGAGCTGASQVTSTYHNNDHQEYRQPADGSFIHLVRDFTSDANGAANYPVEAGTVTPGGLGLTVTLPIARSAHTVLTCESADPSNPAFCDDKRADETVRSNEDLPLTLSVQFTGFPESLPTTPGTISGLIAWAAPACTERNVSGEGGAYDRVTCMVSSSGTWTLVTTRR